MSLAFIYIYLTIHVVLFIYHVGLRTHLDSMNVDELRQHMIDPSILPQLYSVDVISLYDGRLTIY